MARRRGETPLSQQVANHLRDAIKTGEYPLGALLPSQRRLAADHNIAHNTAREALLILVDEGLVRPQHGKGFIVRAPYSHPRALPREGKIIDSTDLTQAEAEHLALADDDPAYALAGRIFFSLRGVLGSAERVDTWWVAPGQLVIEWAAGPEVADVLDVLLPSTAADGRWDHGVPGLRLVHQLQEESQLVWLGADHAQARLRRLPTRHAAPAQPRDDTD